MDKIGRFSILLVGLLFFLELGDASTFSFETYEPNQLTARGVLNGRTVSLGFFKEQATQSEITLNCRRVRQTQTGARYACFGTREMVNFIYTRQRKDGVVVIGNPDNRRFFRCQLEEMDAPGIGVNCVETAAFNKDHNGQFISSILSTEPRFQIPNLHIVEKNGQGEPLLIRGMQPRNTVQGKRLLRSGIRKVLTFQNENHGDLTRLKSVLSSAGFSEEDHTVIPFPWRDHQDFRTHCVQTVQALQEIKAALDSQTPLYYHCTVGEDRTGYLTGIYTLLRYQRPALAVFHQKMCEFGYGAGNARKGEANVVTPIRESITLLYTKMAYLIEKGDLTWDKLNTQVCEKDPVEEGNFRNSPRYDALKFQCGISTRFRP